MTHNNDWFQVVLHRVSSPRIQSRPFGRARGARSIIVRGITDGCKRPLAERNRVISYRFQGTNVASAMCDGKS